MLIRLAIAVLLLSVNSYASEVKQTTKGQYSPAVAGNNNNIYYYFNGLDNKTRTYYEKQLQVKDNELKKLKKTAKERKIELERYASNVKKVNDFIVKEKNKPGGNVEFATKVEKLLLEGNLDEATSLVGQGAQAGAGGIAINVAPGSIIQNLNNSPGSVQIGKVEGPLTINQSPQSRNLTQKQKDIFYKYLKQFNGQSVHVIKLGDQEAGLFADEIIRMFISLGIKVDLTTIGMIAPPKYGIYIASNKPSILLGYVLTAFSEAGLSYSTDIGGGDHVNRDNVNILIGLRP